MSKRTTHENVALITLGRGGWRAECKRNADHSTSTISGYGEDWIWYARKREIPIVDSTVLDEDAISTYAVKHPMYGAGLGPNEVSEIGRATTEWDGTHVSGMACVGINVFLAHSLHYGCKVTNAAGEPLDVAKYWVVDTRDERIVSGSFATLEQACDAMLAIGETYDHDLFGGTPLGVTEMYLHGQPDARLNAITHGVVFNPAETIAEVMVNGIMGVDL